MLNSDPQKPERINRSELTAGKVVCQLDEAQLPEISESLVRFPKKLGGKYQGFLRLKGPGIFVQLLISG